MLKNKRNIKIRLHEGFSLVEMLVAIGIFMTIMTLAVSSLISIIGANRKAQAIKSTIDSINFAMENISRDMRVGTYYECSPNGTFPQPNKDCLEGGSAVRYINNVGKGITYNFIADGQLTRTQCDSNYSTNCSAPVDLISKNSGANINNMKFYVIGAYCENPLGVGCVLGRTQPRVIITISGVISVKGSADTSFNLQTNISQRTRR